MSAPNPAKQRYSDDTSLDAFLHVYLHGAELRGAFLSAANLCGADLREANLAGADLSGAHYDGRTVWPDGFDPRSAGAVHVSTILRQDTR